MSKPFFETFILDDPEIFSDADKDILWDVLIRSITISAEGGIVTVETEGPGIPEDLLFKVKTMIRGSLSLPEVPEVIIDHNISEKTEQETVTESEGSPKETEEERHEEVPFSYDEELSRAMTEEIARIEGEYESSRRQEEEKNKGRNVPGNKGFRRNKASSSFPNHERIIYGRGFSEEDITPIRSIVEGMGIITVKGRVIDLDIKTINEERIIATLSVTDNEDTIDLKCFLTKEEVEEFIPKLGDASGGNGAHITATGTVEVDYKGTELILSKIRGIALLENEMPVDYYEDVPVKRVELHAHTNKSMMEGLIKTKDLLKRAMAMGHEAIAITDTAVVQAFPEAKAYMDKMAKLMGEKEQGSDKSFKVIYGVDAYIVDDLKPTVLNNDGRDINTTFVVFDLETTGFSHVKDRIIEIGAVKVEDGKITDRFHTFVDPLMHIPEEITELTGITDSMVKGSGTIDVILPDFDAFCKDAVLVAHNAVFDTGFIEENRKRLGRELKQPAIDTVGMARTYLPDLKNYKLDTLCAYFNIDMGHHHRAVDDADSTAQAFLRLSAMAGSHGIKDLWGLEKASGMSENAIKRSRAFRSVILVKNEIGRLNLYKLISASNIDYYMRYPRIPLSLLQKHREGLMLGSGCGDGELFQALISEASDEEIRRLADFYDYLEIMPVSNNLHMIGSSRYPDIESPEDIMEINKRIVSIGERFGKPVCATGNVFYLDKDDEIYRSILRHSKGIKDEEVSPSLYLRTTEEMLKEFAYLGEKKAYEVVVENTNMIAGLMEPISPISPETATPVIDRSAELLKDICTKKAEALYGKDLPDIVRKRMDKELNSIINNGFAVMYIIARRLVSKSLKDGYLVGSRGSVGSSFVAFLSGITEVNALHAHYRCEKCKYSDFDSEYVRSFGGMSGYDMEDRICPVCGEKLTKDGHDIPFETFLGFEGEKEPDIDLNFSGEYQPKAHAYTEVIFGHGQTYRAGTIGDVAEKTAFFYVEQYLRDKGISKRRCEIKRLASRIVGVKRTTGQHPGGIVVLPIGRDINEFTPVQRPADDQKSKIITTHFDYSSIHHNLLKLDILGHDDPTMIRMLQNITGKDPKTIPFDDEKVMSIFKNTDALGVKPEDIGGTELGCLGIPEFGTRFVIQMLLDTKPSQFSSLVRISGLSHGINVWTNNAQELVRDKKATLQTVICARDDIMIYLISMGMEPASAFAIMESVRKGKGLKDSWEKDMREHGVPEWYIDSCNKIEYMFPKAHAVAYVMMSIRVAWFKVYEPLAYYAAYFSIRADEFTYEKMCRGRDKLEEYIRAFKRIQHPTQKEKEEYRIMKIVQEFMARGFEFLPLDLYKSDAARFKIEGNKLLPPFSSIEGMGDTAAGSLYKAASEGPFLSKDDVKQRGKVSQSIIDKLTDMGILDDLPENNQMSLFEMGW